MFNFLSYNILALLSILIASLTYIYFYLTRNYNYWKSRGIDGPKPIIFFGTLYKIFQEPFNKTLLNEYRKYGRIYGTFFGDKPVLVIGDPELVKDIMIRDFHLFVDRNDIVSGDPMNDRSLFNAFGDDWKQLRSIISPTFSSGKMKKMYPLIKDCTNSVMEILTQSAMNKKEVELKRMMGNLTMDVIATCAFATKIDTYNEPNNQFIKHAELVFRGSWRVWTSFALLFTFPKLGKKLKLPFFDKKALDFFQQAITSIMKQRNESNKKQVDFLQLMINVQKKENIDEIEESPADSETLYGMSQTDGLQQVNGKSKFEITEMDIIATAFLFFNAGYETTATLLSYLFYYLTLDQDVQQKLYEEIISVETIDYESMSKMPYLEACVAETLRITSSVAATSRIASQDYKLGKTGITIPKGLLIQVNSTGMHHDPQFYPNPDHFIPERFLPENRHKLTPYTYLPFGTGPRNCVGMRFALMEAKTAITHIVPKFKFVKSANTQLPEQIEYEKFAFLLMPKHGIKVNVELRK